MKRLSSLDSSFLRVETPTAHMHVGWLALVNLPTGTESIDVEALRATVGRRLHHAPRFRQRVQSAPLGEPFLRDDPDFDVAQHISEAPRRVMPARELRQACNRFLSLSLSLSLSELERTLPARPRRGGPRTRRPRSLPERKRGSSRSAPASP